MKENINPNETQAMSLEALKKLEEETLKPLSGYLTLTVIEGRDFGYVFQVDKLETVIGRKSFEEDEEGADVQLDDDRASRRHSVIKCKNVDTNSFYVQLLDLHSKNGTFINGRRINSEDLHNGDKIQVGNSVLKFEAKSRLDNSYQERLYQQVTRDPLTGLWNHNHLRYELEKFVSQSGRTGRQFSLVIVELDLFKTINEAYGRNVGDAILKSLGQILTTQFGDLAIISRYAGTQFLAILPEIDVGEARSQAEKVQGVIKVTDFSNIGCQQNVTCSIGITHFPTCGNTTIELLKQVDEALYLSKQIGGNRVSVTSKGESRLNINWKRIALAIILILVISSISYISYTTYTNIANQIQTNSLVFSGVVEEQEIQVGSKVGGRVKEVLVKEGDSVTADTLLVRFDIADLLAQHNQLEARLAQAQAYLTKLRNGNRPEEIEEMAALVREQEVSLQQLKNGSRPQEIAQAKADLTAAEADLNTAQVTLKRLQQIYEGGYISKQDRDLAENRVDTAAAHVNSLKERLSLLVAGTRQEQITAAEERYNQALNKLKVMRNGSRPEDITDAEAKVKEIEAQIESLDVQIKEGEIKAPGNARVEVMSVRPGDLIAPGRTIIKLLESDQVWVRAYVPETEMAHVSVGQSALVTIDSIANKSFAGYVKQINAQGEFLPRNIQTRDERKHQVFGLKISIDNKDNTFKSGMSAEVRLLPNKSAPTLP